jgi:hypothetical protein
MHTEGTEYPDPVVAALADLFREHPAWVRASAMISPDSTSNVYFRHRENEAWHLARREDASILRPGSVSDPDFVFRFAPGAIERLQRVEGSIAEFAIELFSLIDAEDENERVEFRVVASFSKLRRSGYLQLLIAAGPKLLAFAAKRGVLTPDALKTLVTTTRTAEPFSWEC